MRDPTSAPTLGAPYQSLLDRELAKLTVHHHLCLLYETQEEQFDATTPFMHFGLERGEKCLYVVDENTSATVLQKLQVKGHSIEKALRSGQLEVLTAKEAHLKEGYFKSDPMIASLENATSAAKGAGFTALRATGEMTLVLSKEKGVERLAEYEAKLNFFFPHHSALGLCQYNLKRFSAKMIKQIIQTHPFVIFRGALLNNFYYAPPMELLSPEPDQQEVRRMLTNLSDRVQQRNTQSLLRLSRRLERAQTYIEALNAARDEVRIIIGYQNLWAYLLTEDKRYAKALVAGGPMAKTVMAEEGVATLTIRGDRMLEEIAEAKDIVVVEDARTDERTDKKIVARMGNRTIVNVPIFLMEKHIGSIGTGSFGDEGVRVPTQSEQEYLSAMASHMAVTLDRIHLLTERKRAEAELVAAKESAEKAASLKSRFLDIAAHELRTPITVFSIMLELAQKQLKKGQPIDISTLDRLQWQAKRLSHLVVDLLDVSRLERGVVTLHQIRTNMILLISACLEGFIVQAPKRSIIFTKPQQPIELNIDPVRINQVLSNLLDNALKYTSEGSPIEVRAESSPDLVRVSVIDHGVGIKKDQQAELFKPFTRGSSDREERTSGLGLGLFVCRGIIELHGGTIGVVSEAGVGSTFYFELPRKVIES